VSRLPRHSRAPGFATGNRRNETPAQPASPALLDHLACSRHRAAYSANSRSPEASSPGSAAPRSRGHRQGDEPTCTPAFLGRAHREVFYLLAVDAALAPVTLFRKSTPESRSGRAGGDRGCTRTNRQDPRPTTILLAKNVFFRRAPVWGRRVSRRGRRLNLPNPRHRDRGLAAAANTGRPTSSSRRRPTSSTSEIVPPASKVLSALSSPYRPARRERGRADS